MDLPSPQPPPRKGGFLKRTPEVFGEVAEALLHMGVVVVVVGISEEVTLDPLGKLHQESTIILLQNRRIFMPPKWRQRRVNKTQ